MTKISKLKGGLDLTRYEELLDEAYSNNLIVKEKALEYYDGRIKGNKIAIRKSIETSAQKACVLAEELGHHYTSVGDILDLSDPRNEKQEYLARLWAFKKLVSLDKLVEAFEKRLTSSEEIADFLEVTVPYLNESIELYTSIYGSIIKYKKYIIQFNPCFTISKIKKGQKLYIS